MYDVEWRPEALDMLAAVWADEVAHRSAITAATNDIDRRLQADPIGESESRADGRRILGGF